MPTYTLNDVITNRIDKKVNYGKARTNFDFEKGPNNESIVSPIPNPSHNLWVDSHQIGGVANTTNNAYIYVYKYNTSAGNPNTNPSPDIGHVQGVIELTRDPTVVNQRTHLTCSTVGTASTRIGDWLRATYGASYLPKFAIAPSGKGNGNYDLSIFSGYREIYPQTTNEEWYFDYESGVFSFMGDPNGDPPSDILSKTGGTYDYSIYLIQGFRYHGTVGLQNYTPGGGGNAWTLAVKEINDPGSNVSMADVTEIQFDVDSGFALTDMGNKKIKVAMESTFKHWNVDGQEVLTANAVDQIRIEQGNGITLTTKAPPSGTATFTVTVANSVYYIDTGSGAVQQPSLELVAGGTYKFDVKESSNSGHEFFLSTFVDGRNGGNIDEWSNADYTKGSGADGDGSANAWVQVVIDNDTPNLYYACKTSGHTNMGGSASAIKKTLKIDNPLVDSSGNVTVSGNLTVNGTTTTINSTTLEVDDKLIELGTVTNPDDTTATGGGISLKGATDKIISWANDDWDFSENIDIANGKVYKISGLDVSTGWSNTKTTVDNATDSATNSTLVQRSSTGAISVSEIVTPLITSGTNTTININPNGTGKVQIKGAYSLPSTIGTSGQVIKIPSSGTDLVFDGLSLGELSDVDLSTSPTDGQSLVYSNSTGGWIASTVSGGGSGSGGIALTDLSVTNAQESAVSTLTYNNNTGVFTYTPLAEQDPVFTGSVAYNITNTFINNWNTAHGWGDHGTEGYLKTYSETDPIFTAHVSASITSQQITNWNTAYGWADHAVQNYFDIDVHTIGNLTDFDTSAMNLATNGYMLEWSSGDQKWKPVLKTIPVGLDDLQDVDLTTNTPINNQVLKYDGNKWIPFTDTGSNTIAGLSDTDVTNVTNGKILKYLNGTWIIDDPPQTGATTFTGLDDTPSNADMYNSANAFLKVKSDGTSIVFTTAAYLEDITNERLADLYDVTPITSGNNNDVLYYDGNSGSFKWRDFTFTTLLDTDIPVQNDDGKVVYYNHSTATFKYKDYSLTFLEDVDATTQLDDKKVLYYNNSSGTYKWKDLKVSEISDIDPVYQGDDGRFLQYDFTNSKFKWADPPKVEVKNEGTTLTYNTSSLDFIGPGVNAVATGDNIEVTIPGNPTFQGQTDTPPTYAGNAGRMVIVNTGETGLQYEPVPDSVTTFLGLNDTPGSFVGSADKLVSVNSAGNQLVFLPNQFKNQTDTPGSYSGQGGKYLAVKSTQDAIEFVNPPAQIDTFSALTDTPGISTLSAGKYLKVNVGGTGLEFIDAPTDNTTFSGLTDGPGTLSGYAGKYLKVNTGGTALEWTDAPGSTFLSLGDTPASYAGSTGYFLTVSANQTIAFSSPSNLNMVEASNLTNYTSGSVSTDNVQEGNTNKYYTDARVDTKLDTSNLSAVGDVAYTNAPALNDVLIYNDSNSKWEPGTAPGSQGEANTGSNQGTGTGEVFKTKTGVDLEFRNISAGAGITISQVGDNIQIINTSVGGASGSFIEEDDAIAFAIAFS